MAIYNPRPGVYTDQTDTASATPSIRAGADTSPVISAPPPPVAAPPPPVPGTGSALFTDGTGTGAMRGFATTPPPTTAPPTPTLPTTAAPPAPSVTTPTTPPVPTAATPSPAPTAPVDAQAASDRAAFTSGISTAKDYLNRGAQAAGDITTIPLRQATGLYDNAIARPLRAFGVNAPLATPAILPTGADPNSPTPFYDQVNKADAEQASPYPEPANIRSAYAAGAPPAGGANQDGYPNTMGAPLPTGAQPDANGITRAGNSFSGMNIGAPPGAPTPEQSAAAHAANMAGYAQDSQHLQDMLSLRSAADKNQIMGAGGGGVLGSSPGDNAFGLGMSKDDYAKFGEDAALRTAAAKGSWSPRGGYKGDNEAVQAALAPIQNRAKLAEMSLKNQGDLRAAQLQAQTTMRGQDIVANTSANEQATQRRGQDVTARGNDLTYGAAAQKNQYEAMKENRAYNFEREKFGEETAQKNLAARQAAIPAMQERIKGLVPTVDGKPDMDAASGVMNALNGSVANRMDDLEAQIRKGGPNAAGAQAEYAELAKNPYASFDDGAIHKALIGVQLSNIAKNNATGRFTPWGANFSGSSTPVTAIKDAGFGNFEMQHADHSTSIVPRRYLLDKNGVMSSDYSALMAK